MHKSRIVGKREGFLPFFPFVFFMLLLGVGGGASFLCSSFLLSSKKIHKENVLSSEKSVYTDSNALPSLQKQCWLFLA